MLNLDNNTEDLIQEWAKIRASQQQDLESEKKALAAQHTEVNNQWAQKIKSQRKEVLRAAGTLPSLMVEARNAFIGVTEKASFPPAAATDDPVITAKGKALKAEVQKCMDAKRKLNAAHSQAAKVDSELLETNKLAMDEFLAREAERAKACEDLTVKLKDARQAQRAFFGGSQDHPTDDLNLDLKIRNQLQHDISQALFYLTLYFQ